MNKIEDDVGSIWKVGQLVFEVTQFRDWYGGENGLDSLTGKSDFSLKSCHQRRRVSRAWITLVIITKTWLKVGTENLSWSQIPPPEACQGTDTSHKWTVDHWGKSARKDDCILSNILALLEHMHHCSVRLVSPVNCKGWGDYIVHKVHSFGDKAIDIMKMNSYLFSSLPFPFLSFPFFSFFNRA